MKIYQIDSSARKEGSTSRALAKKLLDKIKKPEDKVAVSYTHLTLPTILLV